MNNVKTKQTLSKPPKPTSKLTTQQNKQIPGNAHKYHKNQNPQTKKPQI